MLFVYTVHLEWKAYTNNAPQAKVIVVTAVKKILFHRKCNYTELVICVTIQIQDRLSRFSTLFSVPLMLEGY